MHIVALICTAILGLLLFGLGLAVSVCRFRDRRSMGYVDDPANRLHKLVRAHANTTEFAPFLAVLILYLGAHAPSAVVLGLMVAATVSRVLLVIGLVDNLLRPVLVGKDTGMPDYVVMVTTVGGMAVFGINGFVIGPAIAAMFFAVWHIEVATRSGIPAGTQGSDGSPTGAPSGAPVEPAESGPHR